ncbi:hypothetical protein QJS10_CPA10g00057 [Acorus calamus]|uniref:Uncharacterized protein n=1 Tax=Acorus calamus TaxID=4465 RepID=A0AAV9DYX1_ACOCL|nr:hypothetical protein QJS10_CPA10g00057 [Acorus calamus]
MEAVVDFDDFDLDALLQSDLDPQILLSDDQDLLLEAAVVDPPIQTNDLFSPDWVSEIEQFLLVEGEEEEVAVEADPKLFEDIFAELFAEGSSEEGRSDDSVAGSDGRGVSEAEERGEKGEIGVQEVKVEEEEDPLSKKRKRIPAVGFPVLAREHGMPILSTRPSHKSSDIVARKRWDSGRKRQRSVKENK